MIAATALGRGELFQLAVATSGLLGLAFLIWSHARGRPLLFTSDAGFRRLDVGHFAFVFAGVFVVAQAGTLLAVTPAGGAAVAALGLAVVLGTAALAYRYVVRPALEPQRSVARSIGLGLFSVWAALPVIFGAFLLCQWLTGLPAEQPAVERIRARGDGWRILVLLAIVVAPIVEEVAFRGILYPALRQRWGRRTAVIASSLLFAVVHWPPTVYVPLGLLAVVLAWLVETTGSILAPIAAHMAFNALTIAILVFF